MRRDHPTILLWPLRLKFKFDPAVHPSNLESLAQGGGIDLTSADNSQGLLRASLAGQLGAGAVSGMEELAQAVWYKILDNLPKGVQQEDVIMRCRLHRVFAHTGEVRPEFEEFEFEPWKKFR